MRRMVFIGALLALLVLPTVASAANHSPRAQAVKDCRALKASLGRATFRATYGRAPMVRCVRQLTAEERENRAQAVADCRAEREADVDAFQETYGVGPNNRGAFGRCVAQKRRAESRADRADIVNAAKACKAERADWGADAFRDEYGTNENGRNAFGKCVSGKADEADDETGGEVAA
jgi:hypothetical protein